MSLVAFAESPAAIGMASDPTVWPDLDVADYPRLTYSMKAVVRAGKALKEDLVWTDESAGHIKEVFKIANSWRDSHAFPMKVIRQELIGHITGKRLDGLTGARIKQMASVRRKLIGQPHHLNQIQDLGGCRAVLPSIAHMRTLIDAYSESARHGFDYDNDYVSNPKEDGYRCHHLIYRFAPKGGQEDYEGRRIEIQVRTRLQHSWATAVEAVGLFRNEDFKGGGGDPDWRRLFLLMSGEIAIAEECEIPPGVPATRRERLAEIRDIDGRLGAVKTLETLRNAFHYTETFVLDPALTVGFYLIRYNNETGTVSVEPMSKALLGVSALYDAEIKQSMRGDGKTSAVLVEIESIKNLMEAFPNYFGDVNLFLKNLRDITKGKGAKEYTMAPQRTVPPRAREKPDMSWFRGRKRWR